MEKLSFDLIEIVFFSDIELKTIFFKEPTLPQTIKWGSWSHHDYIWSRKEWCHSSKSIHLDFLIDRCFFLNIGTRAGKIALRLIIIKIRNKIMHCIIWEKWLKLSSKLSSKGLIVRDDQCRLLNFLNNICHSKGLSRSCCSKQSNTRLSLIKSSWNLINRLWLVSGRLIIGF